MIAVVTLLRILARMSKSRKQATSSPERFSLETRLGNNLSNVGSFIILRSGEGVASSTKVNSANFSGKKMVK